MPNKPARDISRSVGRALGGGATTAAAAAPVPPRIELTADLICLPCRMSRSLTRCSDPYTPLRSSRIDGYRSFVSLGAVADLDLVEARFGEAKSDLGAFGPLPSASAIICAQF